MHPLVRELLARGPIVTDGAWGTQLQARGLALGEFPDYWNLSRPEAVTEVARSYVEAGSQIILTNTFGANAIRLALEKAAGKVTEINRRGVELSREAANGHAKVFASVGPTGTFLLSGEVSAGQVEGAFSEQARALAAAGADGFVIETMSDIEEAKLALRAARQTGLPVVVCQTFDSGKQKDRTMMGTTPETAAAALTAAGADVIGANCGQGIEGFVSICRRLKSATDRPIWVKPNAGLPKVSEGRAHYTVLPEQFADQTLELIKAGASFVGGCCGTTPEFIAAISRRIRLG